MIIEITDDGGTDLGGSDRVTIDFLIEVDNTTSTAIVEHKPFEVYPNPVGNVLNIKSADSKTKSVSIIGLDGKELMLISQPENQQNIDVRQLPEGLYFIKITDAGGNIYTAKFFKN